MELSRKERIEQINLDRAPVQEEIKRRGTHQCGSTVVRIRYVLRRRFPSRLRVRKVQQQEVTLLQTFNVRFDDRMDFPGRYVLT